MSLSENEWGKRPTYAPPFVPVLRSSKESISIGRTRITKQLYRGNRNTAVGGTTSCLYLFCLGNFRFQVIKSWRPVHFIPDKLAIFTSCFYLANERDQQPASLALHAITRQYVRTVWQLLTKNKRFSFCTLSLHSHYILTHVKLLSTNWQDFPDENKSKNVLVRTICNYTLCNSLLKYFQSCVIKYNPSRVAFGFIFIDRSLPIDRYNFRKDKTGNKKKKRRLSIMEKWTFIGFKARVVFNYHPNEERVSMLVSNPMRVNSQNKNSWTDLNLNRFTRKRLISNSSR